MAAQVPLGRSIAPVPPSPLFRRRIQKPAQGDEFTQVIGVMVGDQQ